MLKRLFIAFRNSKNIPWYPDKDGYLLPTEPLERGSAWKCDRCGKLEASERVEKTMKEIKELGENINILAPLDVSHFSWDFFPIVYL